MGARGRTVAGFIVAAALLWPLISEVSVIAAWGVVAICMVGAIFTLLVYDEPY